MKRTKADKAMLYLYAGLIAFNVIWFFVTSNLWCLIGAAFFTPLALYIYYLQGQRMKYELDIDKNSAFREAYEAILSGDFDPLTEDERLEIYGDENDRF